MYLNLKKSTTSMAKNKYSITVFSGFYCKILLVKGERNMNLPTSIDTIFLLIVVNCCKENGTSSFLEKIFSQK